MKLKMLVLLVLLGAVLVSASVGTLSGYTAASAFSAAITVDTEKIEGSHKDSLSVQAAGVGAETTAQAAQEDMQAEGVSAETTAQAAQEDMQAKEPEQISE